MVSLPLVCVIPDMHEAYFVNVLSPLSGVIQTQHYTNATNSTFFPTDSVLTWGPYLYSTVSNTSSQQYDIHYQLKAVQHPVCLNDLRTLRSTELEKKSN